MNFFSRYKKLLIICFVLLFTLFGFEIISERIIQNDWVLSTTSDHSSIRWELMWMKAHSGKQATTYPIDAYHPILGWAPLKNATNVMASNALVNFNRDGIRGKKIYEMQKKSGVPRIIVVGDSYSFGEEVTDNQSYPAQLEQMMSDTEVLNMAVHGYGIDQMTMRLDLEGYAFHPDIVLYAFTEDDFNRASLTFRDYMKPRYILLKGNLTLDNVPIPAPDILLRRLQSRPAIVALVSLLKDRILLKNPHPPTADQLTKAIWRYTAESVKNHQAIPVFLYLPTGEDMTNPEQSESELAMFAFCRTEHMYCISARPYLIGAFRSGTKYNIHTHYEPVTNRIIAEGLAADLGKTYPYLKWQNPGQ